MVEEMKAEARSRGISLHLKNLMERDEEWAAEIERVFAEAKAVAAETGLALTLPGTAPAGSRRCDFVEEGSAFVSWNGNVHPATSSGTNTDVTFSAGRSSSTRRSSGTSANGISWTSGTIPLSEPSAKRCSATISPTAPTAMSYPASI
jgi:hypothetical protein